MHNEKYEVRKARSEAMIGAGIDQMAEWRELLIKAIQHPATTTKNLPAEN